MIRPTNGGVSANLALPAEYLVELVALLDDELKPGLLFGEVGAKVVERCALDGELKFGRSKHAVLLDEQRISAECEGYLEHHAKHQSEEEPCCQYRECQPCTYHSRTSGGGVCTRTSVRTGDAVVEFGTLKVAIEVGLVSVAQEHACAYPQDQDGEREQRQLPRKEVLDRPCLTPNGAVVACSCLLLRLRSLLGGVWDTC